jgi:hypothetical protein
MFEAEIEGLSAAVSSAGDGPEEPLMVKTLKSTSICVSMFPTAFCETKALGVAVLGFFFADLRFGALARAMSIQLADV